MYQERQVAMYQEVGFFLYNVSGETGCYVPRSRSIYPSL